uniref:DNA polymerase II subunit 2 n=1 Tax=Ditylum brightwellii TaxID=49249 RepID=A0A6V2A035_9STRA
MTGSTMMASSRRHEDNSNVNRRKVARAFKMRGLSIQTSALNGMMNVLRREENPMERDEKMYAILDEIKERMMMNRVSTGSGQLVVTEQLLADVVAELTRNGMDVAEEAVQLLGAFEMPRLAFDSMRKQFSLAAEAMEDGGKRSLFGSATNKVDMYAQRFALIQQRIMRQDLFRPKLVTADGRYSNNTSDTAVNAGSNNKTHVITPIESLLGRTGIKVLLGMIVQVEEGRYYLEDHTGQVPMDLTQTEILTDCFLNENCIVLVEGEINDAGVLTVHRMGNPIIESRLDSLDAIGLQNSDIFSSISSLSELEKLREQEIEHGQDGMFVILSDVHLDNPAVMRNLDTLFEGFEGMQPLPLFVFMGNFVSRSLSALGVATSSGAKMMVGLFDELANLISKYPAIAKEGRFVFIPGPNDAGLTGIMPRPPLPNYFTASLRSKVPHAVFTSNPCRLRFFSKEIVFCREDIVSELKRSCLLAPPQEEEDPMDEDEVPLMTSETDYIEEGGGRGPSKNTQQVIKRTVKTLLDQGHLCPLPLPSCPIYWQYDHALRLYPLPDAVVVADRVEQYYENYAGCDAINPGPFHAEFSFVVYRPVCEVHEDGQTKSDVEFSQI